MRVVLVDDEPIALDLLAKTLEQIGNIKIVGRYTNPYDAIEEIDILKPDIVFLDIEMGKINGLETAEIMMDIYGDVEIVFVTAYSQYAIDAFEVNAIDYLVKPIQKVRLSKTIQRIRNKKGVEVKPDNEDKLTVDCLGFFRVKDASGKPLRWRTRKAKELFAFLWMQEDRVISKNMVMELIFPNRDVEEASAILHTTIYQLRTMLKSLGYSNCINYFNDSYQLKIDSTSDFSELKRILPKKVHSEKEISRIIELYKGDFLEEEGYHWAIGIQQNIKNRVSNVLKIFVNDSLYNNNYTELLKSCLLLLEKIDPYDESVVRMTIIYYGELKNRPGLKVYFDKYVKCLQDEMGLQPKKNIVELYFRYIDV